jgi:hypothetical protein
MNLIKREEKETSEVRYELLLKISTDSDIVRLMIIYSFVDKFNSRFRYDYLLEFAESFPKTIVLRNFIDQPYSYHINFKLYVHVITMLTHATTKNPMV